jgi:hypothetical protein
VACESEFAKPVLRLADAYNPGIVDHRHEWLEGIEGAAWGTGVDGDGRRSHKLTDGRQ